MKKILLLGLLLLSSCSDSGKGKLVKVYQDLSYGIDYENYCYVVVLEVDKDTHKVLKSDSVSYADVHYVPQDYEKKYKVKNEYLIYEKGKEFIIYYN